MKKPMSDKTPAMRSFLEAISPGTMEAIDNHQCPMCHEQIGPFRDSLSIREYEISGLCQACQDQVFGS